MLPYKSEAILPPFVITGTNWVSLIVSDCVSDRINCEQPIGLKGRPTSVRKTSTASALQQYMLHFPMEQVSSTARSI